MPWLAYEFKDEKKIKIYLEFKKYISGIPCLIIINPEDGSFITADGRGLVVKHGV